MARRTASRFYFALHARNYLLHDKQLLTLQKDSKNDTSLCYFAVLLCFSMCFASLLRIRCHTEFYVRNLIVQCKGDEITLKLFSLALPLLDLALPLSPRSGLERGIPPVVSWRRRCSPLKTSVHSRTALFSPRFHIVDPFAWLTYAVST